MNKKLSKSKAKKEWDTKITSIGTLPMRFGQQYIERVGCFQAGINIMQNIEIQT